MRLFVYGSLRAGGGNDRLLRGLPFTRYAQTRPGWSLFEYGGGSYPVMMPVGRGMVQGEVITLDLDYPADTILFHSIDMMERGAGYHLHPIRCTWKHSGLPVPECFTYAWFAPDDDWIGKRVESGDWIEHIAQRVPEAHAYRDARL